MPSSQGVVYNDRLHKVGATINTTLIQTGELFPYGYYSTDTYAAEDFDCNFASTTTLQQCLFYSMQSAQSHLQILKSGEQQLVAQLFD